MKILVISSGYPSENRSQYCVFIKQQLDALRKLGDQIDVMVPDDGQTEYEIRFQEDAVENRYVLTKEHHPSMAKFKNAGIQYGKAIEKFMLNKQYDLIAVHITGDVYLAAAVYAGQSLNIPVVQHYHGLNVWLNYKENHPLIALYNAHRRAGLLKKCSAIIGVSNKVSDIVRQRIHTVPVYTLYNGVNIDLFYPQKDEGHKEKRIISVGNLIPIKGMNYLISAFAKVKEIVPLVTLEIVGEGELREKLENQVEELGVGQSVIFSGRQPYDEVARRMRQSDLFVLDSFYEAIGCVYLEAMACELPTIGVKGMGIDEIIVHGENGLLAEPKDINDLADQMLSVLKDSEYARKLGSHGRKTVEKITWENSAVLLEKIYQKCLQKGESK